MWWVQELVDDKEAEAVLGRLGQAMGMALVPMRFTRRRAAEVRSALEAGSSDVEAANLQSQSRGAVAMSCLHFACGAVMSETLKDLALVAVRAEQKDMRGEDDCGMGRPTALGLLRRALVNGEVVPLSFEKPAKQTKHVVVDSVGSVELPEVSVEYVQASVVPQSLLVKSVAAVSVVAVMVGPEPENVEDQSLVKALTEDAGALARSQATKRANETRGAARRREITVKGNQTRGAEYRREISLRAAATMRARRDALAACRQS